MTLNTLINILEDMRIRYDGDADIDTVTLLDGDWLGISGWACDRDGEDIEIDERYNGAGVELSLF